MAAFTKIENAPVTRPGAGQNRKVISGFGTLNAAAVSADINVTGQISRVTRVMVTPVNHAEVICVTTAQPVAGLLTFSRAVGTAAVSFWYEIEGF